MPKRRSGVDDAQGLLFTTWNGSSTAAPSDAVHPAVAIATTPERSPLVQRLPWDFRQTFPQPTPEAIETGVIDESDLEPENLASLHDNYADQCLAALQALDMVMDARRRGIDPGTGTIPKTPAAKERLRQYLNEEPGRLERTFTILMETYSNAFGDEAADAFTKALRARHAGIDVVAEVERCRVPDGKEALPAKGDDFQSPPPAVERTLERQNRPAGTEHSQPRIIARFPVPRPLPQAVRAGRFGRDDKDKPIFPDPDEVYAITVNHAQKLIDLLGAGRNQDPAEFRSAVAAYAEDFGEPAAARLEAYARRKAALGETADPPKGRGR